MTVGQGFLRALRPSPVCIIHILDCFICEGAFCAKLYVNCFDEKERKEGGRGRAMRYGCQMNWRGIEEKEGKQ